MAYISYNNLWESEFDNIVSRKDKIRDMKISQLEVEVHESYKKDENLTTNFEAVHDEDVINKAHPVEKKY